MYKIKHFYHIIKSDNFWNNLVKNSFWAFLGDSIASVITVAITIVLIRIIGSDSYGLLVLGQTYMTILDIIINVQSWKGVIQYGQKSLVKNDLKTLGKYVQLGIILDISTALLCGIIAIFLAPIIGNIFNWNHELTLCSQLFSITIFFHFAGTPTAILRLANKFNLVALQKFIAAIIKLSLILFFFLTNTELSLITATIVYVITDIIGNIILILFAIIIYQKKFDFKYIFHNDTKVKTSDFVKFTLWGTVSEIVDIPVNYLDVFIVSTIGIEMVSIYKVFKQIIGVFQKITSPIQQSIMPQFSELSANGQKKRGFEIFNKIRNVTLTIGIPIAILIGITSPYWLNILYGKIYAANWTILFLLLIIQIFALSYSTIHPYFLSLDKPRKSALYILLANTLYIFIAYALIHPLGLFAIVIAFAIQCFTAIHLKIRDIKKEAIYE